MTQANAFDANYSQPLLVSDPARRGEIAPGLLRVLRQAVGLRFVLLALAVTTLIFIRPAGWLPPGEASWVAWLLVLESAALLVFVLWDRPRAALEGWFLPVALGWFLVASIVEQALAILAFSPQALARFGRDGLPGVGVDAILLVLPVILATWQYGRQGLLASLATLLIGYTILAPLVSTDPAIVALYLVGSLGRLAMIALLGYVVLQLVNGLRAEHQGLVAANRQLAQRAATAEQLAESRERNRLARELHDILAHSLTGLSVQLKALETLMIYQPDAVHDHLVQAQATVRSGIQESRRAIKALRATPLEDLGLSEALRQLCSRLAERLGSPSDETGLRFNCAIAEVGTLDPLTEQTIYRVAESALNNVEQHASASTVWVNLHVLPDQRIIRLEVRDDGIGFEPAAVPRDRFGLAGMCERAQLLGASLRVESSPGHGTRIVLEVEP